MKPCIKCGGLERYADGQCKACKRVSSANWYREHVARAKAARAAWHAKNRDKANAKSAKYYADNKKNVNAANANWRREHPDEMKTYRERWAKEHPESRRIRDLNRRARIKWNGGKLSAGLVEKLFKSQRGKCPCCGLPLGEDYHLDHRIPLARGGAHEDSNMQLLRKGCNHKKHTKDPIQFMQERGFLL